ncbi:MAG: D-alanine--D-alanine ligase [Chitinispirillia bacterium]|jgi:D-alanine-D-alanine ligase
MKKRIGIIFGGKSAEHEVSLQSAKNIIESIDKERYEPVLIGIDKNGIWHLSDSHEYLLNTTNPRLIALNTTDDKLSIIPGSKEKQIVVSGSQGNDGNIDVAFPVLHGPYGEDGAIQGLLKLANIPFVGASVLGSAVGMDKDIMKRLLRDDNIPVADYLCFLKKQRDEIEFAIVKKRLGLPLFVKPANLGSSVGISKVESKEEFTEAIQKAFEFDRKIIIEEHIPGREIECAVLGNDDPVASVPGEVKSNNESHGFYSYEAKYIDENGAILEIPAKLEEKTIEGVKKIAVKAFTALCCEGMARVDCFLKPNNEILVNEINTIPGFTKISMYPKLWEASGKSYTELITDLIELASKRYEEEQKLKTSI